MTFEQIEVALRGLHRIGMRELSLDGGEPLTHPRVADVVNLLADLGVVTRMNTNGILVPKRRDVVRKLSKVKISLDGPEEIHDRVRGRRAFTRAVDGANAARALGVPVELTCVVGTHNEHAIDELMSVVSALGFSIVFQPARDSLFVGTTDGPGRALKLDAPNLRRAFDRIESHKLRGAPVANSWASLRHFRGFPTDKEIPCAAGFINATLDPRGNLHHCGQAPREVAHNVVLLGVDEAFRRLSRVGCGQCWCARVVEENYAWGGRFAMFLPPRDASRESVTGVTSSGSSARRLPLLQRTETK
jgi:MoaA/NifB/PqqE/SkfB family radical SAM enzyme